MKCGNCGAELSAEDRFCGECGAPRPHEPPPSVPTQPPEAQPPPFTPEVRPQAPPPKKRSSRRWLALGCVLVVIVACLAAGALLVWALSGSVEEITIDLGPTTLRLGGSGAADVATRTPAEVPTLAPIATRLPAEAPTLAPIATPTPEMPETLFSCTSEDLDCGWETRSDASREIYAIGHELFMVAKGPYGLVEAEIPGVSVQDFYLYFEARLSSESGYGSYGVAVRCDPASEGDFYEFQLLPSGEYRVWEWVDSEPTIVDSGTAAVGSSGENSIAVFAIGPSLSFLVNAETVAEISDAEVREGPIRLVTSVVEEAEIEVAISYVVVEAY